MTAKKKAGLRKAGVLVILAMAILMFSSCIDILETIETSGNQVDMMLRISFSKSLIEGAASMSGEEPDYSDLPDFTGEDGMINDSVPGVDLKASKLDNDVDYGVTVNAHYNSNAVAGLDEKDRTFLPYVDGKRIEILLPPSSEEGEMDEMTAMFFGSAKFRILIKQSTQRREVDQVLVGGEPGTVSVTSIGDVVMVEVPLTTWLMSTDYLPVEIIFR